MHTLIATLGIATALSGATAGHPAELKPAFGQGAASNWKPITACELLSAGEIAAFLKVPAVHIDSINSGMNDQTHAELCSWYVQLNHPEGVMFKLRRAGAPNGVTVQFLAARIDEGFPAPAKPVSIVGIGDAAQYMPYPDGTGGTIIVMKGTRVVTILGSASEETLVSMAKAILPRL